jgi:AcrR family transcriptional regulator
MDRLVGLPAVAGILLIMPTMRDKQSPAQRLLDTASTLFAREGIRAVGIDRILAEAKVARASLYQNYGSKDALVVAYLRRQHEQDRTGYERAAASIANPRGRILLVFDLAARNARRRHFRGCLYLNAATEFPDPKHAVNAAVRDHRDWLDTIWTTALGQLGVSEPTPVTARLTVLYDGGLAGSKVSRDTEPILQAKTMAAELLPKT